MINYVVPTSGGKYIAYKGACLDEQMRELHQAGSADLRIPLLDIHHAPVVGRRIRDVSMDHVELPRALITQALLRDWLDSVGGIFQYPRDPRAYQARHHL